MILLHNVTVKLFCYVAGIRRPVLVQWNGNSYYRATGRPVHFIVSVSVLICVSLFPFLFSFCLLSSVSFSFVFVSLWLFGSHNWKPTPLIKMQPTFYVSPLYF
jgi:hypothetical protein